MKLALIQQPKANMGAEAYDNDKFIAVVNSGAQMQTYISIRKQQSAKNDYYVFEINQVLTTQGQEIILQTKRTTHYHKAIGIAVSMNA
jgi:hypothetical protein